MNYRPRSSTNKTGAVLLSHHKVLEKETFVNILSVPTALDSYLLLKHATLSPCMGQSLEQTLLT